MYRALDMAECTAEKPSLVSHSKPHTLVLQPTDLDVTNYREFQTLLEEALNQALQNVIVDFLWVERVDEYGIQTLVSGIEWAAKLGKTISFAAMSLPIQSALEAEWDRQRDIRFGSWQDLFGPDLEQFLEKKLPA